MEGMIPVFPERPDIEGILDLPLKSDYRALLWTGLADGTNLTLRFAIGDLVGRSIVLKSFSIYPYTSQASEDFFVEDSGATEQWVETIAIEYRMNRIFDAFEEGTKVNLLFNGVQSNIFFNTGISLTHGFPLDLSLDNIFYKFPAKIQTWDIQINARAIVNLQAGMDASPNVKVVCECYIL
ncbi:MAG: hypothetical protein IH950_16315 [Bacteroidetes bacterium]|nr:hypothetical protein [Bacteroidota bacterium]